MVSLSSRRLPRPAWSIEECALFAARKEYELLVIIRATRIHRASEGPSLYILT